jgi:hypothetical protein
LRRQSRVEKEGGTEMMLRLLETQQGLDLEVRQTIHKPSTLFYSHFKMCHLHSFVIITTLTIP